MVGWNIPAHLLYLIINMKFSLNDQWCSSTLEALCQGWATHLLFLLRWWHTKKKHSSSVWAGGKRQVSWRGGKFPSAWWPCRLLTAMHKVPGVSSLSCVHSSWVFIVACCVAGQACAHLVLEFDRHLFFSRPVVVWAMKRRSLKLWNY